MESINLSNVTTDDGIKTIIKQRVPSHMTAVVRTHSTLEPVIKHLAVLKPTWKFTGTHMVRETDYHDNTRMNVWITAFTLSEDQEILGNIRHEYGRSGSKILVSNERINNKRQRGRGYSTENPDKAIARVKKEFGRRSPNERLVKALEAAHTYIYDAHSRHNSKHREAVKKFEPAAAAWATGEGFPLFMEYAAKALGAKQCEDITAAKQQADALRLEMHVLEDIRNKLGGGASALVVRDLGQYIVRIGDNVQIHDDNTLPASLRGRLGMLKLVDKEHFIENAGCRVSEEVFVVLLDEEASANNVSQGV